MVALRRSVRLRLRDILDEIAHMQLAIEDVTYDAFAESWVLQRACERAVEIISEASRHVPDDLKNTEPDVPWREIAGIGNVLRHGYETINAYVIWDIATKQVGLLGSAGQRILARIEDHDDWNA